ncbi:MAG: DUF1501 domain-containing protein [Pirellulaceae bacterium]
MSRQLGLLHEANQQALELQTRRHFLRNCTTGLGGIWLASQGGALGHASDGGTAQTPAEVEGGLHHPRKIKNVIFLHMIGAPSQLELFDYCPELERFDGKDCPQSYLEGQRFAFIQGVPQMLGPQFSFKQHGESGAWVSDRLPEFAKQVDDVCFIKSMQTDQFNHGPAQLMVHTGQARLGYPSMGSWVTWGLGRENEDLPGFIVLLSGGRPPRVGKALWSSGFLPSVYQGVQCRSQGEPVLNVNNPQSVSRGMRRDALDTLQALNQENYNAFGDPETLTRISQYEMAFRMQTAVPDAMDISQETQATHELYGTQPGQTSFANNCLLARRLVERGVRFVQLFDWGWDTHGSNESESLKSGFVKKCDQIDRPMAGLLSDLKARGLLEETLIVWSGEFGRTPMGENRGGVAMRFPGRDHNPNAFTMWMAGGGVKPGMTFGSTDELGYLTAENPVQVRDFHATLLHLLGIDHQKFTFPFQGLNQKLTGVLPARVVDEVLL